MPSLERLFVQGRTGTKRIPSRKIQTMKNILLITALALGACSTEQQKNASAFLASPTGQALIHHVETTAVAAATNAIQQYEDTGKVQGAQVAKASLSSVSQQLRGLQATDQAADPAAITTAVKNGSASPVVTKKIAPAVATAVTDAVKKGLPPDAANEAAARGLDKAAKGTPKQGKKKGSPGR
jgi:hypothetical protein